MDWQSLRWIGDAALALAVSGVVLAAGRTARSMVAAERARLEAEADSRCAGESFRLLCSAVGRAASDRGFREKIADIDSLVGRAGLGRLHSGRETVGRGVLFAGGGLLVLLPLAWTAAGPVGVVFLLSGAGLLLTSIRSGLVTRSLLRKREIEGELPYTLDLLGLCMSARASEVEALAVASGGEPRTAMTDVMERVRWQCEHNVAIADSVAKVGEELQVEALVRLGMEIARSRSRGTDLPEILRALADSERRRRFDAADAYANEVTTRMLGPSGLVFASSLILMLGPVVMHFVTEGL